MSSARSDLERIYTAAIRAVQPCTVVPRFLRREGDDLLLHDGEGLVRACRVTDYDHIYLIGAGKASASMALPILDMLGDALTGGCICVKEGCAEQLRGVEVIEAGHPLPDERGFRGARAIHAIARQAGARDLVISLISGGASALIPLPPEPITLAEKQVATDLLLKCGAPIHEINTVRKHLSLVKGGNLARTCNPATVINLVIADVVGNDLDIIASGPFVPDRSTPGMALGILQKYRLLDRMPRSILRHLGDLARGVIPPNPRVDDPCFAGVTNVIIASNRDALAAARNEAVRLGYNALVLSSLVEGDTKNAALWHSCIARESYTSGNPAPLPACLISGGETTVVVKGSGCGGRNMEFALYAAGYIDGLEGITMASIGTDGIDGPTDAAGAFADASTFRRAAAANIDVSAYLLNNDSYHFFSSLNDLLITGPTKTNVMDMHIFLIKKPT